MTNKVKITAEQAKAIAFLKSKFDNVHIIQMHRKSPTTWRNGAEGINGMSLHQLQQAMMFGYEIGEQVSSQTPINAYAGSSQLTDLQPIDYQSMIDLALATGDKQWFDELCSKSREGSIA